MPTNKQFITTSSHLMPIQSHWIPRRSKVSQMRSGPVHTSEFPRPNEETYVGVIHGRWDSWSYRNRG